jgi:signal transduction histidine kinase
MDFLKKNRLAIWFVAGTALLFGLGLYWLDVTEKQLRDSLLNGVKFVNDTMLSAVDADNFSGLTLTEEDGQDPAYLHLREQFIAVHRVLGEKMDTVGSYAFNTIDDEIRFIVDSADEDDPWHSPPGTVYEQPSADIISVIRTKLPVVNGPYTDEYGTFYTASAPLFDSRGEVVAFIGTDIKSSVLEGKVHEALIAPRLIVLLAMLLYFVASLLVERQMEVNRARNVRLREAVESERAKTDFINIAVHQLKTPLTALKWSVEMLEDIKSKADWSEEESGTFEQVVAATHHLDSLVAALLSVGRLESGGLKVEPRPTALKALVADVIDELKSSVAKKGHKVTVEVPADIPEMNVDPNLVREVFKNFLTNAIKYSSPGSKIEVVIRVIGQDVVFSVKDRGIGIPKAEQKRVFDKFFRASNVGGWPEGGTGLGLYLAKQVADLSGGKIWLESTEGSGSTFYFSLPLTASVTKAGGKPTR